MEQVTTRSWKAEFARSAAYRREQERFFKEADRRLKEDRREERIDGDLADLSSVAVMASDQDLAELRIALDRYDAATVEALMMNEQQLEEVRARIQGMLDEAYVLPDGRRVFKSADGRVFDEHGIELGADELDPSLIEDWRPGYEEYRDAIELRSALNQERADLLDYQDRIDGAREKLEGDDVTEQDIKDIRDDLDTSMPMAVREIARPDTMPNRDLGSDFEAATKAVSVPPLKADLENLGFGN